MKTALAGFALFLTLASSTASAGQFDKLGGLLGGSSGSPASGSLGNAAGIIQYCVSNNYLGGDSGATGVKDQLLGKLGGQATTAPTQDKGYLDGAKGLLKNDKGKTIADLGGTQSMGGGDMKAQLTRKVCDAVLKQGRKWVGM